VRFHPLEDRDEIALILIDGCNLPRGSFHRLPESVEFDTRFGKLKCYRYESEACIESAKDN
jgi:hypothetical protein